MQDQCIKTEVRRELRQERWRPDKTCSRGERGVQTGTRCASVLQITDINNAILVNMAPVVKVEIPGRGLPHPGKSGDA